MNYLGRRTPVLEPYNLDEECIPCAQDQHCPTCHTDSCEHWCPSCQLDSLEEEKRDGMRLIKCIHCSLIWSEDPCK